MQIQCSFRAVSEQFQSKFPVTFQPNFISKWPISEQFQSNSRAIPEQFQSSFRAVSEQFQSDFRTVSEQYKNYDLMRFSAI